jgi:hypothetical protein
MGHWLGSFSATPFGEMRPALFRRHTNILSVRFALSVIFCKKKMNTDEIRKRKIDLSHVIKEVSAEDVSFSSMWVGEGYRTKPESQVAHVHLTAKAQELTACHAKILFGKQKSPNSPFHPRMEIIVLSIYYYRICFSLAVNHSASMLYCKKSAILF